MHKFNVWDVCRYYMPHSPELHGKLCRIVAVSNDWNDYSTTCMDTAKKHFVEQGDLEISELYNNTKSMTTTAKVIQERIVKKYLTNKKLDELTEIIEKVRVDIETNKTITKNCKSNLDTLEDIDYCLNKAIDEGNIDDIKTMEKKYKEFLNCN